MRLTCPRRYPALPPLGIAAVTIAAAAAIAFCANRRLAAAAAANPSAVLCHGHPHHVTHVVAGGNLPSTTGNGGLPPHQL